MDVTAVPNPFLGLNAATYEDTAATQLRLVDGGLTGAVSPLAPLAVAARDVDLIVVIDAVSPSPSVLERIYADGIDCADFRLDRLYPARLVPRHLSNPSWYPRTWSRTTSASPFFEYDVYQSRIKYSSYFLRLCWYSIEIERRQEYDESLPVRFPFLSLHYGELMRNNRMIAYIPNYLPGVNTTNQPTSKLVYTSSEASTFLDTAFTIVNRGYPNSNSSTASDPQFPICMACTVVERARGASGVDRTPACEACFTRYCWNESEVGGMNGTTTGAGSGGTGSTGAVTQPRSGAISLAVGGWGILVAGLGGLILL